MISASDMKAIDDYTAIVRTIDARNAQLEQVTQERDKWIEAAIAQQKRAKEAEAWARTLSAADPELLGVLQLIADMPDEEDEWDGRDKFHQARESARAALARGNHDV